MRAINSLLFIALAACSAAAPKAGDAPDLPKIESTDFALVPCAGLDPTAPCALVRAGGKRVLIGAPAGVSASLTDEDLRQLDSVLLFSLRAGDIDGLGEVRNASWHAGRQAPLPVSGPTGTRNMITALNKVYEVADARHFVEAGAPGGYNAALLQPAKGESDTKTQVFNTGDLIITHLVNADGLAGYWVDYEGRRAILAPCGMTQAEQFGGEADAVVTCGPSPTATKVWPLKDVHFVEAKAAKAVPERPEPPVS